MLLDAVNLLAEGSNFHQQIVMLVDFVFDDSLLWGGRNTIKLIILAQFNKVVMLEQC